MEVLNLLTMNQFLQNSSKDLQKFSRMSPKILKNPPKIQFFRKVTFWVFLPMNFFMLNRELNSYILSQDSQGGSGNLVVIAFVMTAVRMRMSLKKILKSLIFYR